MTFLCADNCKYACNKKSHLFKLYFSNNTSFIYLENVQDARSSVKRLIQYLNATGKLHQTLFMANNRAIKVGGIFIF